jgi:hypothetical protein
MASAASTPKIVLSGTATATITNVSQKACCASGVVTAFHAAAMPSWKALMNTSATGIPSSSAR